MSDLDPTTASAAYLRVNRNTRKAVLAHLATSGHWRRLVFSASALGAAPMLPEPFTRHASREIILDTESAEAAVPAFAEGCRGRMPWATGRTLRPAEMDDDRIAAHAIAVAEFAGRHHVDVVLSPGHLLGEVGEPWLSVDVATCFALREALDRLGLERVAIDYVLLAPAARFADPDWRAELRRHIAPLPFRQLWVRVGGFGLGKARHAAGVIEAVTDLAAMGRPIVLDAAGGMVGLAPAVLGLAGGLCHGLASRTSSDFATWQRPPSDGGGIVPRDLYYPMLERSLTGAEVDLLDVLGNRQRKALSCATQGCCASDAAMRADRKGHFLRQVELQHDRYLAAGRAAGQRAFRTDLWAWERELRGAALSVKDRNDPGRRLLEGSAARLGQLRDAIGTVAIPAQRPIPPAFDGRAPVEPRLPLEPPPVPRPCRPQDRPEGDRQESPRERPEDRLQRR
jgi:hypothetical protein